MKDRTSDTLVGSVLNTLKSPLNNLRKLHRLTDLSSESEDIVWALKDVNFDVYEGEVVGIIGSNGAGKSTLLKILSQITEPSTGEVRIQARVAALLEVGTGFHPELTGRENIYMNGTILGMRKKEIDQKIDEIVYFSGVEKYLDTPVKFYSSGMRVRLGFSVAAHLEPEILIVDEVLAVGDAEFQEKCIRKMGEVTRQGRTVLFVSHSMGSVAKLCQRCIVLSGGKIVFNGEVLPGIEWYLRSSVNSLKEGWIPKGLSSISTGEARFTRCQLLDARGAVSSDYKTLDQMVFALLIQAEQEVLNALIDIKIISSMGVEIVHLMNAYDNKRIDLPTGENQVKIVFTNKFQPGLYRITIGMHNSTGYTIDYVEAIQEFRIHGNSALDEKWMFGHLQGEANWILNQ